MARRFEKEEDGLVDAYCQEYSMKSARSFARRGLRSIKAVGR